VGFYPLVVTDKICNSSLFIREEQPFLESLEDSTPESMLACPEGFVGEDVSAALGM